MRTDGPFALPADRATFERAAADRPDLATRAAAISAWADAAGTGRIASYGVGAALLELLLWRANPTRDLVLSDYTPAAVERLAGVFPEVAVRQFDLLRDAPLPADAQLLHRVDTELTNAQWRAVLRRFAGERVLLVASEVAGLRRMSWEIRKRLARGPTTRAGWLRNRAAFERLWRDTHDATPLPIGDLQAWDLRPRVSAAR